MRDYIEERVKRNANYILENSCTIRECAKELKVTKSTVHKDVTHYLPRIDMNLYLKVREVIEVNKAERASRGGTALQDKIRAAKEKEEVEN